MLGLDRGMEIVDVVPPSGQSVVIFLYKEHFANHDGKVIVFNKKSDKQLASIPLEVTPRGEEVSSDVNHLTMVVEDGDVHGAVSSR